MKTAFKILPVLSPGKSCHLLAEAGRDTISLLWYSKDPLRIEGLFVYQPAKENSDGTLAEQLQKLLATENLPHYHSAVICYNFKESLLVPVELYNEANNKEMLACLYGDMPGSSFYAERVQGMEAYNAYRVPSTISETIDNRFFGATVYHSNSLLAGSKNHHDLYCIVYNTYIKAMLFIGGKLQMIQLYDYNTPSDVAYHLLNICQQHHISPAEITLTLSGFIERQSNLYEELYRYFLNVEMDAVPSSVELSDETRVYPEHFFSFLTTLVTCVS